MANLTLTIDDEALCRVRTRAAMEGTSVNAVVRTFIDWYANDGREQAALLRIAELAERSTVSSGAEGRSRTRDELYDR